MSDTRSRKNIWPILNKKGFEEGWLETYATFWNKEASGILQKPWTDKLAFPLDWALMLSNHAEYDALNQFELMTDDAANGTTAHADAIAVIKTKWPKDNSGPIE